MPRGRSAQLSAAAAAGAALVALALPRAGFWPFGWFALGPLFFAANSASTRRGAAAAGFWAGFAYHAVVLHWIFATCRFARIPVPVALLAWAALAGALALNWALVALLGRWLSETGSRVLRPWTWALAWTAVAAASGWWTPRLAVDVLAYTQWPNLGLIQAGAWGGPYLVGFALVLVNSALAEAWLDARAGASGPALAPLSLGLALAAALWAHGETLLLHRPTDPGTTARVEILQPAIDQYRKFDDRFVEEILDGYEELLARPSDRAPALVVWPETSLPIWLKRTTAAPPAARWAARQGAEHLVGIVASGEGFPGPANAVQLVEPNGVVAGVYVKRELVPFGEYVPLRSLVPRFVVENWLAFLDAMGDLQAGAPEQPLLATAFGATSVTICYEAMFPRWARRDAARGARLLVNVTNDGWYKDTWGPYQHFEANVFRAIENRITVIRSGNTGISAVIDPWGVVTAKLDLNERGRLDADVPLSDPFPARSLYARRGDWLGALCLLLTLALGARRALIRP
jgi:apolipoprotein N-acyltransferase